jgi:hypothetical protein
LDEPLAIINGCNPVLISSKVSPPNRKFYRFWTNLMEATGVFVEKASGELA